MSTSKLDIPGYGKVNTASLQDVSALCQSLANRLHKSFAILPSAIRAGHYAWREARQLARGEKPLLTFTPAR